MHRYQKRPGIDLVFIPGYGKVREGTVLTGEQFAKFCPSLLVEVPEAPMPAQVQPSAQLITEVMPVVVPPPAPTMPTEVMPVVVPPPPSPTALTEVIEVIEATEVTEVMPVVAPPPLLTEVMPVVVPPPSPTVLTEVMPVVVAPVVSATKAANRKPVGKTKRSK